MKAHLMSLTALICAIALATPTAAIEFRIDRNHSTIGFCAPIMGLAKVTGKFTDFTVTIAFDEADVTRSSVTAVIKTASIDTGVDDRDKHLRSADFFDAEKHPEIMFHSTRIEKRGDAFVAHGDFSMRGVTRTIAMPFRITGRHLSDDPKEPGRKLLVMGFSAAFKLNRRDYGVNWQHNAVAGFVADEIEIEINLLTRAVPIAAP